MHQMCAEFLEKYHIDAVRTSQRPVREPTHPSSPSASIGLIADSCGSRRSTKQSASSCLFRSSVGEEPTPGRAQQLAEPEAVRAALGGNACFSPPCSHPVACPSPWLRLRLWLGGQPPLLLLTDRECCQRCGPEADCARAPGTPSPGV